MATEPKTKNVVVFIDGQNLFHCAKQAFGYTHPNFDVRKLADAVCRSKDGWRLKQIRFYTGVPDAADNAQWHEFWSAKLAHLGKIGVHVFSRPLRYVNETIELSDGTTKTKLVGREKGIDVRIALDIIRLAHRGDYDVALIFSQDQDLSEAADEIRVIAKEQKRWIRIASVFPNSPTSKNTRGINGTDWIKLDRTTYDACIDPTDYRKDQPARPTLKKKVVKKTKARRQKRHPRQKMSKN